MLCRAVDHSFSRLYTSPLYEYRFHIEYFYIFNFMYTALRCLDILKSLTHTHMRPSNNTSLPGSKVLGQQPTRLSQQDPALVGLMLRTRVFTPAHMPRSRGV